MQIKVLGCSGAIGGDARTTSFLVDNDVLIDSGTGVGDLSLAEMSAIDHIFLTHSHLDHIALMPLLIDSVAHERDKPITLYARQETIESIQSHIFNWKIWPDFTAVPTPDKPFAVFREMPPGSTVELNGRRFRSVDVNHTVPAVAYIISGNNGSFAFSGDTSTTDAFWEAVNRCDDVRHVVIETTFTDADRALSDIAKHLCPELLGLELGKLKTDARVHITHLMPGQADEIMKEIAARRDGVTLAALERGQVFSL